MFFNTRALYKKKRQVEKKGVGDSLLSQAKMSCAEAETCARPDSHTHTGF